MGQQGDPRAKTVLCHAKLTIAPNAIKRANKYQHATANVFDPHIKRPPMP
jgi:hypothetical protein